MQKTVSVASLRNTQRWMRWIISHPSGVEKALEKSSAQERAGLTLISSERSLSAARRIEIYATAYLLRLKDALAGQFPAVRIAIGDELFHALASDYLASHPSRHYSLEEVGRNLAALVKRHGLGEHFAFLAELAELEWQIVEAFFAADLPPLNPDKLTSLTPEVWPNLSFKLDPSVTLLNAKWPVDDLWRAHEDPPSFGSAAAGLEPLEVCILVYRSGGEVRVERIDSLSAQILKMMLAGRTLQEIGEEALTTYSEGHTALAAKFSNCFGDWVAKGIIRDLLLTCAPHHRLIHRGEYGGCVEMT